MGWNLVNWTGNSISRINNPIRWDMMRKNMTIYEEYKQDLIHTYSKLEDKPIEYALYIADERNELGEIIHYVYLFAFCLGLAYRNMGMGWSFVGSAMYEKKIAKNKLVYV